MSELEAGQDRITAEALAPHILDVDTGPPHEGDTGQGLILNTDCGQLLAILHQGTGAGAGAVLWVWGTGGGYAGPAEGVFANLAQEFTSQGITSLRLNYRYPGVYKESVLDVVCGLQFLKGKGYSRVALVGHSFGGAVVIAAATASAQVAAVVSLSPQTTEPAAPRSCRPAPC